MDALSWLKYYILGQAPEPTGPAVDSIQPSKQYNMLGQEMPTDEADRRSLVSIAQHTPQGPSITEFFDRTKNPFVNYVLGNFEAMDPNKPYTNEQAGVDAVTNAIAESMPVTAPVAKSAGHAYTELGTPLVALLGTLLRSSEGRSLLGIGEDALAVLNRAIRSHGELPLANSARNANIIYEAALSKDPNLGVMLTSAEPFVSRSEAYTHPTADALDFVGRRLWQASGVYSPDVSDSLRMLQGRYGEISDEAIKDAPSNLIRLYDTPYVTNTAIHEGIHANDANLLATDAPVDFGVSSDWSWHNPGVPKTPSSLANSEMIYNNNMIRDKLRELLGSGDPRLSDPYVRQGLSYAGSHPSEFIPTLAGNTLGDVQMFGTYTSPAAERGFSLLTDLSKRFAPFIIDYLRARGIEVR